MHHILDNHLPLIPVRYTVMYSEAIIGLAHLNWKCNLAVVRRLSVCLITFSTPSSESNSSEHTQHRRMTWIQVPFATFSTNN